MSTNVEQHPPNGPENHSIDPMLIGPIFLTPQEAKYEEWLAARPARLVAKQIEEQLRLRSIDPASVVLVSELEIDDIIRHKEEHSANKVTISDPDSDFTETEVVRAFGADGYEDGNTSPLYGDLYEDDNSDKDPEHWGKTEDPTDISDEEFETELAYLHRIKTEEKMERERAIDAGELHEVDCATLAYLLRTDIQPNDNEYPDSDLILSRGLSSQYDGKILIVDRNRYNELNPNPIEEDPIEMLRFNSIDDILRATLFEVSAVIIDAKRPDMDPRVLAYAVEALTTVADTYRTELAELETDIASRPPLSSQRILQSIRMRLLQKQLDDVNGEISAWTQ